MPRVTVVMAVRNEAGFIARSLGCVLAQDYPADRLEIVVADGESNDGTREAIESLQASDPRVILLSNPLRIVAGGLNAAIRRASGVFVVRVDGHTEIAPDYVRRCVEALNRTGADNAGGRMDAVATSDFGRAVVAATSSRFGVGGARFHYSEREEWVDTVYLGAWKRALFEKIGLFDEELVRDQDDELNYRLRAAGGRILLSPEIRSRYTVRGSPRRLWKQYYGYGFWKVRVLQKHTAQMQPRQFVPPVFVASVLASGLAAPFSAVAALVFAGILGAYAAANLLASGGASKGAPRLFGRIAAAFAILHFSYGAGFLAGLVRFAGRWRGRDATPQPRLQSKGMERET
jgi:glycosyltransferase involved in cell wall biosynthesis